MKKADVTIGGTYIAKVSGKEVPVMITHEDHRKGWHAKNLTTGRAVRILTAGRLRRHVEGGQR